MVEKESLAPLIENLRIDLAIISKDMRKIAVILKNERNTKIAWRLFIHADTLESHIERLK